MPSSQRARAPLTWKFIDNKLAPAITLGYQILALLVFAAVPILANNWLSLPFPGAFIEPGLVISMAEPSKPGSWQLRGLINSPGYHLTAVEDVEISTIKDLHASLAAYSIDDQVQFTLQSSHGEQIQHPISLIHFAPLDQIYYLFVPYLVGLVYLLSGLWVYSMRRRDPTGRAFPAFTASIGIILAANFDLYTTQRLSYLWTFCLALAGGCLINLALIFPEEGLLVRRYPFFRWVGYIPAALLAAASFIVFVRSPDPSTFTRLWQVEAAFGCLALIFFLGQTAYRRVKSASPIVSEQSRYVLWGSALSFLPLAVWFILTILNPELSFRTYLLVPLAIFPVFSAYAILRHRLLSTDYLASRLTLYGLLTAITIASYGLIVTGLSLVSESLLPFKNPFISGFIIFIFALVLIPLRAWMQARIDQSFSRAQSAYREKLQAFSRELTQAVELPQIIAVLRRYTSSSLHPAHLHIFVYDSLSDHYIAAPGEEDNPTTDLRFASNSPLVESLAHRRTSVLMAESQTLPAALLNERARIALLNSHIFIPLPGREHLAGWMALGTRRTGEPFIDQDIRFLESLADQAALAVERAQVVANLERRVKEMNVLARVSQGINVTVSFDDILELIYAQTIQIIPTIDFRITLHDSFSNYLYHVFYLEEDERYNDRENKPLPLGKGLEQEVIQSHRPLVTDDYERECRARAVLPNAAGLVAWAGVPLNAGAETIGVLSLGSRDLSVVYTSEQINLLHAIADQAAGAIVKARLLKESERRTRQLTSLNEVARSLTSTLSVDTLLHQILQSAESLLNCESGSLLMIDETTGELVYKFVTRPGSESLIGSRIPPGEGLAGKAVQESQPILANDVRKMKDFANHPEQGSTFDPQDLLVVPLQIKDRVIGVIEVVNRKDGLPFNQDDQELLAAFTSQAAVAIENARLYTLTDQALAARVEELSVMQRIDRELNASLNVERAIHITLAWAMRQSGADAGLVASVEKDGLRVMAYQGYTNELARYEITYLPEIPTLKASLESGQAYRSERNPIDTFLSLLPGARAQIAVPIHREDAISGVIFLESTHPETTSDEVLAFLSRLSDHASIAIANARLYAEVQSANLAKSDFVSFVSHELKTPMTSIKGFTDLLFSGVVGPVNDTQRNFLSTIRSNVDRMVTLVTDLADVSRIEAGRLRLDFSAVPVTEVVEEVTRSIRSQVEEKKQSMHVQLPAGLPSMWGDRTRLIQIITNLVSNAHKYSPEGGSFTICAEVAANTWDEDGPPKVLHISVQDSGCGISEQDQKKIFQKFFRSDDQQVRDVPGTGLGLNITKQLVEMQGGKIWFVSQLRVGTTFHFTVPIAESV